MSVPLCWNAELVSQDGVEIQNARAAAGEDDFVHAIGARCRGEEVERLAQLAREILRDGVEDWDDLLDGVISDLFAFLEFFGLLE